MDQKKLHILSLLAALTAATIFGMSFMFSKMALATAAPTVLLAFRFMVAVAAMSLVIALNALVGKVRGKPLFAFSLKGKPVGKLLLEFAPPTEISATPPIAPRAHSTCRRVTRSCRTSTSIRMQHTGTAAMMVPATAAEVYRMP